MPLKKTLFATALSFAAVNPLHASGVIAPISATAGSYVAAMDHENGMTRIKNEKEKKKDNKNSTKGQNKAKPEGNKNHNKAESKISNGVTNSEQNSLNNSKRQEKTKQISPPKVKRSQEERVSRSQRVMTARAPEGRDMTILLSSSPLALLGQDVIFQDVEEDRLLTYRNCPPGLAKKNPPCVPPGLAEDGVTYDQWVTYNDQEFDQILRSRRDRFLRAESFEVLDIGQIDDTGLLLNSDQVAQLFDLRPAQSDQRYALIDGMPVLLEDRSYAAVARINDKARVPMLANDVPVAPTAALTQAELVQAYNLPQLDPGYSYSVLNGEVLALENDAYETLQLIRIARAVF